MAIAEHPIASKYVVKLEYDTEGLKPISCKEFDQIITSSSGVISQRHRSDERPGPFASARAWRAYDRDSVRSLPLLSERQTRQRLNQAWSTYEACQASQKKLQEARFFPEKIAEAMKRFRNLKEISTPTKSVCERYVAEIKDLLPNYYFEDWISCHLPSHIGATSSVLLTADSSGLQIATFCCHRFKWQIFSQNKNFAALKRSIRHLKNLNLTFADPRSMRRNTLEHEIDIIGEEYLDKGRVREFLTSAPSLESLTLSFKSWPSSRAFPTVKSIFGNFHWSCLVAVNLARLDSMEDDLLGFCKRHAHTLRNLSFRDMNVLDSSWELAFHRLRRTFRFGQQLESCKLSGSFLSLDYCYDMEDTEEGYFHTKGILISDYIESTELGDVTLNEYFEAMHLRYLSSDSLS